MRMRRLRAALALVVAPVSGSDALVAAQQPSPVVTVTGCVQPESAVLKRNPLMGAATGDDYVLTSAALNAEPDTPRAAGVGKVYRLTGTQEKGLKAFVGQRLEITGRFKDKEKLKDDLSSVGTSGRTEAPTRNNTPEIIIDSFKLASGACTPAIK